MKYQIESFCDDSNNSNTYLIYDEMNCIIIDPSNNIKTLNKFINKRNVCAILLTHGHYDHFKMIESLIAAYHPLIVMHKNALNKIKDPLLSCANLFGVNYSLDIAKLNANLKLINADNIDICIESLIFKVIMLPGHTNCSIGFLIDNNLFSGDMVFLDSVGRWDLPTGNYISLAQSIKKLKTLDDNVIVYPGHDASFSLKDVKLNNRYFKC